MFRDILYSEQIQQIGILKLFSREFYLAWWTAIALQLWHRKSIDFDLFSGKKIQNSRILSKLREKWYSVDRILVDSTGEELTVIISWVKITFLYYPFAIEIWEKFEGIGIPDLMTLGAMKFYTLGRRWKWKDYVDVYFLLNSGYNLSNLSFIADEIFGWWYNEKLLREQLCYYEDIDYTEQVEYIGENPSNDTIKKYLCQKAIEG